MRYLYRFVGKSRLTQARTQLASALREWSSQWRVDHTAMPLVLDVCADADFDAWAKGCADIFCHSFDDGRSPIHLHAPDDRFRALIFGSADAHFPCDQTADALLLLARHALVAAIAKADSASAHVSTSTPGTPGTPGTSATSATASPSAAGTPWIICKVHFDLAETAFVSILLNADRFNDALPPPTYSSATLVARKQAIANTTQRLTLSFPLATIRADELRNLQPGVVVRAEQRLDDPIRFGTNETPTALAAWLGQHDGRLAVRIAASQKSTRT